MTTAEKCEECLKKIVEIINENGAIVSIEEDLGGNSLTIRIGNLHTHCGYSGAEWELLIDNLYNSLHDGPGLSWA